MFIKASDFLKLTSWYAFPSFVEIFFSQNFLNLKMLELGARLILSFQHFQFHITSAYTYIHLRNKESGQNMSFYLTSAFQKIGAGLLYVCVFHPKYLYFICTVVSCITGNDICIMKYCGNVHIYLHKILCRRQCTGHTRH